MADVPETNNLATWNRFADIDPKFTKPITGKAYRGTSPNPQYVIRCLTELFGPVGKGFGWEVIQDGFTPLGDEVLHWCRIRFWTEDRSNAFESYGQTKALMKTRNGMMSDEDAPKKSLTDAIVKAASHVGIAANIFLGRWDDQKYVQEVADNYRERDEAQTAAMNTTRDDRPDHLKANGKPEKGWRADGTRTTYWLKTNRSWDALKAMLDEDLVDCHSLVTLETLKNEYRKMAQEQRWNRQYLDSLTHEFNNHEKALMDQMDAKELAEVPLRDALTKSLAQHPISAG
jgi:hypothetical protein